jgi:hypothetical protein
MEHRPMALVPPNPLRKGVAACPAWIDEAEQSNVGRPA